jgi:hypothetical protein
VVLLLALAVEYYAESFQLGADGVHLLPLPSQGLLCLLRPRLGCRARLLCLDTRPALSL